MGRINRRQGQLVLLELCFDDEDLQQHKAFNRNDSFAFFWRIKVKSGWGVPFGEFHLLSFPHAVGGVRKCLEGGGAHGMWRVWLPGLSNLCIFEAGACFIHSNALEITDLPESNLTVQHLFSRRKRNPSLYLKNLLLWLVSAFFVPLGSETWDVKADSNRF